PDWVAEEAGQATFWQGLADLARWAGFRWIMREEVKPSDAWYGVLVVLALMLGWRMFGGRRISRKIAAAEGIVRPPYPGEDSEFYAVEKVLAARVEGETHAAWVKRISPNVPLQDLDNLRSALLLHQRYRFDPAGLAAS